MSATTPWDTPAYQRIVSATPRGDKMVVLFEDRSWVEVDKEHLIRPGTRGARWDEATSTPYEVVVPTAGDAVEIPWSTIRALTDRDYSAYLVTAAETEAREIGLRIRELRERRGLTGKELAERAGIAPQSLSRIEHGHHDVVFTTLRRLLAAMGYSLADLVPTSREPISVGTVMKRLASIGLSRDFVLQRLLPQALGDRVQRRVRVADDESLARQVADEIGSTFGWSIATILSEEPLSLDRALPATLRFKRASGADSVRRAAYAAYAHSLSRIVHDATRSRAVQPVPEDPDDLRFAVLDRYGAFSFESLLSYTWSLGIPVIPLHDVGVFHGACWRIDGRPIIVLKQRTKAHARWMFDLLHELKHVASHLHGEDAAVVEDREISPIEDASEEREASAYAGAAILFGRAEELTKRCVAEAHKSTEQLKRAVQQVAAAEHVPADALANYIAFRLSQQHQDWWGPANNLQITDPPPWVIARDLLLEHIDLEQLDPRARALLRRALSDD